MKVLMSITQKVEDKAQPCARILVNVLSFSLSFYLWGGGQEEIQGQQTPG